jgi:hypothetical protein
VWVEGGNKLTNQESDSVNVLCLTRIYPAL